MNYKKLILGILVVVSLTFMGNVQATSLDEQRAAIIDQIVQLQAQVDQLRAQGASTSTTWCHTFNTNLGYANSGTDEVVALHTALQKEGISYLPDSTNSYTEATAKAVVQFQTKYGISQTGFVGPLTRAKLNTLYKCTTVTQTPIPTSDQTSIESSTPLPPPPPPPPLTQTQTPVPPPPPPQQLMSPTCTGQNVSSVDYYKKGTVSWTSGTSLGSVTDSCLSTGVLREYYCDTTKTSGYSYRDYTCPNGCTNGMCDQALTSPPFVDLKISGSDGPLNVPSNSRVYLTWMALNVSSCTSNWAGAVLATGGTSYLNIVASNGSTQYSITCRNSAGASFTDSVIVNVQYQIPK